MSKVKNISGGPLDVPLLDRQVEADEVVDVPDVQADGVSPIVWPANRWEPVPEPKVAAEKASKSKAAV
jgi:hypothetical protein